MLGRRRKFHLSYFLLIITHIITSVSLLAQFHSSITFNMAQSQVNMSSYGSREYDVIVWGASGYTGALTAEHIARSFPTNIRWAVAGRSQGKLQAVVEKCRRINPDRPAPCKLYISSQIYHRPMSTSVH